MIKFIMFVLSLLLIGPIFAQELNPLLSKEELNIRNNVKKRLYPGGQDEEPVKVQAQMPLITRKLGPTQEIEVPEEPSTTHDAD